MTDKNVKSSRFSRRRLFGSATLTTAGLAVCFLVLVGKPQTQPTQFPEPRRPLVDVVTAVPASHSITVRTQGTVEPLRRVGLVAQVSGKVESVSELFLDGRFFEAGDILLQLEQADYEFAIARARAQEAAAAQRVAEERGRNLQAQREWRDLGTSEANDLFLRKPQLRAAEASLAAAQADVAAAELALERTTVRAPFDGRLEKKSVDLGQFVAPGTVLAQIYATDRVEVHLPISDSQLALLELPLFETAVGTYPEVVLSTRFGGERWQWQGRIARVEASIDRDSRVTFAIAEVSSPFVGDGSERPPLTPGLFVEARIAGKPIQQSVELPATALRGDNTVLLVNDDSRLERLPVELLRRERDRVWVRGIEAGRGVVAEQSSLLAAGAAIEVASVRASSG
ncbi:MAG: efflux RND transporter periplasmic adaptor subunit [Pseudomonadota bacterium]|nr:efflux RND transporter periplasmic adaptor subunit [Pseudomonadota bacterium]